MKYKFYILWFDPNGDKIKKKTKKTKINKLKKPTTISQNVRNLVFYKNKSANIYKSIYKKIDI